MLLAEANQWPEDAAAYFGDGDECHMASTSRSCRGCSWRCAWKTASRSSTSSQQTPPIPDNCQWALFLRNHDELTLEMVTDEERDYMYRVYAHDPQMRINLGIRRRLAPLLGNNRRRIELLNGLLLSLPGTPVIYYGDEIGMGDNIYLGDRNGVRTPMQWTRRPQRRLLAAPTPQRLFLPVITDPEYHYEAVNVEAQQDNPHSLLWWMKRLIALRRAHPAFGRGSLTFLHPDNRRIVAFVREYGDEKILVVANTSRFVQYAELDLQRTRGLVPVEMFGRVEFPRIEDGRALPLTLAPHGFLWFTLEADPSGRGREVREPDELPPVIEAPADLDALLTGHGASPVLRLLSGIPAGPALVPFQGTPHQKRDPERLAASPGRGRAGRHRRLQRRVHRGRKRVICFTSRPLAGRGRGRPSRAGLSAGAHRSDHAAWAGRAALAAARRAVHARLRHRAARRSWHAPAVQRP